MAKRTVTLHDKYKSTTALYPKIDVNSLTPDAITEITRITEVVVEEQVVPNPTPTGEEPNLEYITINNVTYKVPTGSGQVQSNWNETDTDSPAYIQNKPTIPSAQVQSNWNESDNTSPAYIQNKPTIPSAQVQSNWNESDNTSPAYIQNKPTIPVITHKYLHHITLKSNEDYSIIITFDLITNDNTVINSFSTLISTIRDKGFTSFYGPCISASGKYFSSGNIVYSIYGVNSPNANYISCEGYRVSDGTSFSKTFSYDNNDTTIYDIVEQII